MEMGRHCIVKCLASVLALAAFVSAPAHAAIDDLQIDWIILPSEFAPRPIESVDGIIKVKIKPLPRELFIASADIVGEDGTKLLPAGAQLYRMIGAALMACSQSQEPDGYVGASNRICLRDTDGDGLVDAYFIRSRGRSFVTGDQMWFAMNNNLPTDMAKLRPVSLVGIANTEATERPVMDFDFYADKKGRVYGAVTIEGKHKFSGRCHRVAAAEPGSDSIMAACLVPDLIVRSTNFTADKLKDRKSELEAPNRPLTVRFDVAPRLMGARLMSGVYFN